MPHAYEDEKRYAGPKTSKCLGCRAPCARSPWGHWCYQCNVARMKRIDKGMAELARSIGDEKTAREIEG